MVVGLGQQIHGKAESASVGNLEKVVSSLVMIGLPLPGSLEDKMAMNSLRAQGRQPYSTLPHSQMKKETNNQHRWFVPCAVEISPSEEPEVRLPMWSD